MKQKPIHHAEDFGLDVTTGDDDMFRWFLLSYLFGKPIQSTVAVKTWKLFIDRKLDTPWAILQTHHRKLVNLLDEGKYTRYDESMARALHTCMKQLIDGFNGSLSFLNSCSNYTESARKQLRYSCARPRSYLPEG